MDGELGRCWGSLRCRRGLSLCSSRRFSGTSGRGGGLDLFSLDLANGQVVVVGLGRTGLGLVVERGVVIELVVTLDRGCGVVVERGLVDRFDGVGRLGIGRLGLGRARRSVGHPFVVTPGARHMSAAGPPRAPVYPSGPAVVDASASVRSWLTRPVPPG